MPWYVAALLLSQPLHFGDYRKLPLKIAWAILDVIPIVVLVSGLYLWLKKKIPVEQQYLEASILMSRKLLDRSGACRPRSTSS